MMGHDPTFEPHGGRPLAHVWPQLDVGSTRLAHRVVMTSLTTNRAEGHVLSDRHIAYYRERARGGVALIVTEQHGATRGDEGR